MLKKFQDAVAKLTMMTTGKFQNTVEERKMAVLSQMDSLMKDYPAEAKRVGSSVGWVTLATMFWLLTLGRPMMIKILTLPL